MIPRTGLASRRTIAFATEPRSTPESLRRRSRRQPLPSSRECFDARSIRAAVAWLQAGFDAAGVDVRVVPAAEVRAGPGVLLDRSCSYTVLPVKLKPAPSIHWTFAVTGATTTVQRLMVSNVLGKPLPGRGQGPGGVGQRTCAFHPSRSAA